ncbi:hypothetical protein GCM10029964_114900 [Kibdelosporangium lantanae]
MTTNLRIADIDRQATETRLRTAHEEGRLDADELTDRLGRAWSARTSADLAGLVVDLPRARPRIAAYDLLGLLTRAWIAINVVNFVVWVMTVVISGHLQQPWFLWSLVLPGVGIAWLRQRRSTGRR